MRGCPVPEAASHNGSLSSYSWGRTVCLCLFNPWGGARKRPWLIGFLLSLGRWGISSSCSLLPSGPAPPTPLHTGRSAGEARVACAPGQQSPAHGPTCHPWLLSPSGQGQVTLKWEVPSPGLSTQTAPWLCPSPVAVKGSHSWSCPQGDQESSQGAREDPSLGQPEAQGPAALCSIPQEQRMPRGCDRRACVLQEAGEG